MKRIARMDLADGFSAASGKVWDDPVDQILEIWIFAFCNRMEFTRYYCFDKIYSVICSS